MKITQLLGRSTPLISFEFFPPKTDEGVANLLTTIGALKELAPSFVSMTYGAGGTTRERTVGLVSKIRKDIGLEAVAHLTCVGQNRSELLSTLNALRDAGIENILALRGDPPKGDAAFRPVEGGFRYAAQLVRFIKEQFNFCVGVAGYPEKHVEAVSLEDDLLHLREKVDAGADFVVTQLFFDNADYFSFVKRLNEMRLNRSVIAGIMPVSDLEQIKRFTTMCGARLPGPLLAKLERAGGDKEEVARIGIDHATAQCEELLSKGAAGIHFYTLNKSRATRAIFLRLKQAGLLNGQRSSAPR